MTKDILKEITEVLEKGVSKKVIKEGKSKLVKEDDFDEFDDLDADLDDLGGDEEEEETLASWVASMEETWDDDLKEAIRAVILARLEEEEEGEGEEDEFGSEEEIEFEEEFDVNEAKCNCGEDECVCEEEEDVEEGCNKHGKVKKEERISEKMHNLKK